MSATEFVARAAYRPAYLAHAIPSLGTLAFVLVLEDGTAQGLSALLLIFFGGVLYSYGEQLGSLLNETILLRHDNAHLIVRLNEEKKAAEATRDQAQAGERAKTTFISNVSQELRTPLNAILGMAQLLERSELEKAQRDLVKVLLEAGRGLKTLLDDIIALANEAEETITVPLEGCDAGQAARTGGAAAAAERVGKAPSPIGEYRSRPAAGRLRSPPAAPRAAEGRGKRDQVHGARQC